MNYLDLLWLFATVPGLYTSILLKTKSDLSTEHFSSILVDSRNYDLDILGTCMFSACS